MTNLTGHSLKDKEQQQKKTLLNLWSRIIQNNSNSTIKYSEQQCMMLHQTTNVLSVSKNKFRTSLMLLIFEIHKDLPAHIWIQIRTVLSPWHRLGALTAFFVLYHCAPTDSCWETDQIITSLICSCTITAAKLKPAEDIRKLHLISVEI